MRKNIYRALAALGAILFAAGLGLAFLPQFPWETLFIRPDLAPFGIGFLGVMLLLSGYTELCYKKTRQEMIEENDERNIAIRHSAMAAAFEAMNLLLGLALVTLALLGYLHHVAFFTLIACYLLANLVYLIRRQQLRRQQ